MIIFVLTQNCRELRVVLHKPSLKMKELWEVRDGLAKPEVYPILSRAIYSVLLHVGCFDIVQHAGGSRMCVSYAWEISPTLIVVPAIYLTKKNKKKHTRALPVETLESLNFIIIITFTFVIYYYCYYYFLFHFMGSPNCLSFSINKAKVKFEK